MYLIERKPIYTGWPKIALLCKAAYKGKKILYKTTHFVTGGCLYDIAYLKKENKNKNSEK